MPNTVGLTTTNANESVVFKGNPTDGASAVSIILDSPLLANASAKLLSVQNNSVEKAFIDKAGSLTLDGGTLTLNLNGTNSIICNGSPLLIDASPGSAQVQLKSGVADGGSAVAYILDTSNALSTSGAKLLSFRNHTTEEAYITYNGNGVFNNNVVGLGAALVGATTFNGATNVLILTATPNGISGECSIQASGSNVNSPLHLTSNGTGNITFASSNGGTALATMNGSDRSLTIGGSLLSTSSTLLTSGLNAELVGVTSATSANPGYSVQVIGGTGWPSDNVSPGTAGGGVVLGGGTGGAGAAGQASGIGVGVTILGGSAGAANGGAGNSTGDIIIDVGSATGAGTNGDIDIGATHATGVHLGHSGAPAYADGGVISASNITPAVDITSGGLGTASFRWGSAFTNSLTFYGGGLIYNGDAHPIFGGGGGAGHGGVVTSDESDGATAAALTVQTINTISTAGSRMLVLNNPSATTRFGIDGVGHIFFSDYVDISGTPGNGTAHAVSGRAAIAATASSCTVTDNRVNANSIILLEMESDGTGVSNVVLDSKSAGTSFTVKAVNGTGAITVTTGNTVFSWIIFN